MPCQPLRWILITHGIFLLLVDFTQSDSGSMARHNGTTYTAGNNNQGINNNKGHTKSSSSPSPEFVSLVKAVKAELSSMAILPCSVKHLGERQVVWRRIEDDEFLTIGKMVWSKDNRILVEYSARPHGVTSWDLLIRNIRYEDSGTYECQVTSSELKVWNVHLTVVDPPNSKPKSRVNKQATQFPYATAKMQSADHQRPPRKEEFVTAGLPIRLMCNTSLGNQTVPRSSLEWYKDGDSIQSSKHVLLTRYQFETDRMYVSELMIDHSKLADSGEYLCRVHNKDLLVVKIYVLPNTTISGVAQNDKSQYYAVDSRPVENGATSVSAVSCSWLIFLLYFLQTFVVINIDCISTYFNTISLLSHFVIGSKNKTRIDPT